MKPQATVSPAGLPLAVSASEFNDFGCPGCGGIFGTSPISGGGTAQFICSGCGQTTLVVADTFERSTMGIGSGDSEAVYPEVVPHPRRGQPVDREQLARDREIRIMDSSTGQLYQWLRLGYGRDVGFRRPSDHMSKSERLPILAVSDVAEDVAVTWFGDNYHFHFLGLELKRPMPATLMYPISSIFGGYPLSGHVNTQVAPPVDFLTAYYGKRELERFGTDCGAGFNAALVIRYLRELSKLDIDRIMDICFHHTRYGAREEVDGNGIEHKDLLEALGLTFNKDPYNPALTGLPADIFDEVVLDLYERIVQGKSAVRVKLAEGTLLPPMPIPYGSICVDLQETALDQFVPADMQVRPFRNQFSQHIVSYLPVSLLGGDTEGHMRLHTAQQQSVTPVSGVYYSTKRLTRDFVFSTPNMLDAALTAFFFVKVLAPTMQQMRQQA